MNNMYISLELSKKLKEAGCELESEIVWAECLNEELACYKVPHLIKSKLLESDDQLIAPAYYILNDICVKYAKEFFGEEIISISVSHKRAFLRHGERILYLLQQGKQQEVEDYIWEYCNFNLNDDWKPND